VFATNSAKEMDNQINLNFLFVDLFKKQLSNEKIVAKNATINCSMTRLCPTSSGKVNKENILNNATIPSKMLISIENSIKRGAKYSNLKVISKEMDQAILI